MLLDKMRSRIDASIDILSRRKFRVDPMGGAKYSRATSIVSAAYKRHGRILEEAIRRRLEDCEYFEVWYDHRFQVSPAADKVLSGRNADIENSLPIELPYIEGGRMLQVDAIVFDRRVGSVRAYEIKRANGHFDAGKKRSILRDLLAVQTLLKSYAEKRGMTISVAEARLIAYYGVKPLPEPLSISGDEMDDHFVFSVRKHVEKVNDYFTERLHDLLSRETGFAIYPEPDTVCDRCPLHNLRAP